MVKKNVIKLGIKVSMSPMIVIKLSNKVSMSPRFLGINIT